MRTSLAERAHGFGIASAAVPGHDPEVVHAACARAAGQVRREREPYLVELAVQRIHGHSTSDAQELYRSSADIAAAVAADPVPAYTDRLVRAGVVDAGWLGEVEDAVRAARRRLVESYAR